MAVTTKLVGILAKLFGSNGQKSATPKMKSGALSFDLLYQLSYMSVIAAAGVPRSQIFERSAQTPCASSEYFKRVELNCRQLQYDYAKACRLVGESAKEDEVKGLLLRFCSSLISGEPESDFLTREAEAQSEAYHNEYGRKLETLRLWTDAYISLILSAVVIIVVGIVSTMIWKIETMFIVGLATVALTVTAMGIWLIYMMSPREVTIISRPGTIEQKLAHNSFRLAVPIALTVAAILLLLKVDLGWVLIGIGIILFPVGLLSVRDDTKVTRRDSELGAFLASLGGVCAATGTTVRESLTRLDLDAIHYLRREVKRLHTRFVTGIRAKLCWQKFIEETGSEVANRSVGMFYDAIDLGGEAGKAGYHASLYANRISMLRARRKTVSSPFTWLCMAMHSAVVSLLIFIAEIITIFGEMVKQATQVMPKVAGAPSVSSFASFNFSGLELMHTLVLPLVVIFTLANAIAPSIADGGSRYKILYNLGLTAVISGGSLLLLPKMAAALFSNVKV